MPPAPAESARRRCQRRRLRRGSGALHRHAPSAVVCVNDLVALGAFRATQRLGLRVPADVAIIGHDDIEFSASLGVPLTSVREPTYEMGQLAARMLLEELKPGHKHRHVVCRPELVVRESSGEPGDTSAGRSSS
nr:substrate-binding domain-containing protein [Cryptosporangium aurantiacum]